MGMKDRRQASHMVKASKVAIVTGAGSGIGKAAALTLLRDGWSVVLAGRRESLLQEVVGESEGGVRALAVPTDVSDPAAVRTLFDRAVLQFGRVDLLFNNAGVSAPAVPLEDLAVEQWRQVVDVNLNGMFFCMQNAFRVMKTQSPRGGRIINNGSISAHAPRPNSIAYTATKHAVSGLTKTASLDGRPFDIAVGQIDIGNVASDMTAKMAVGVPQADGSIRPEPRMDISAVVETFMAMARLPLSANVLFTTVMATKMPFVGRG